MGNLLTLKYWFSLKPEALTLIASRVFMIFLAAFFLLTLIFWLMKTRQKKNIYSKLWSGLYYFNLTNFLVGITLFFLNYEMVPFLSARFWFLLWAVMILIWLYFLVKMAIAIPQRRILLEKEKEYRKYIP